MTTYKSDIKPAELWYNWHWDSWNIQDGCYQGILYGYLTVADINTNLQHLDTIIYDNFICISILS